MCFDCERHVNVHTGRSCFSHHALKSRPCVPLKRKKRAKLTPGFQVDDVDVSVHMAAEGAAVSAHTAASWGAYPGRASLTFAALL
eukprot:1706021-Amphidinium_carterae.2